MRLQITKASHQVHLSGHVIATGEPVLAIHLWNEHLPVQPPTGSDLAWATRFGRMFVKSLHILGGYLREHPELSHLHAVYGATALFSPFTRSGGQELMVRWGFTVLPYHSPLGRFGEFWENFYSWWVIWAYNPPSMRQHRMSGLRRSEVWILTEEFLRRYGTHRL